MAVTIRKKANTLKNFDFKKLIDECILSMINRVLSIKRPFFIKGVTYFPTYTLCKETNEKIISSIHMNYRNKTKGIISAREIEISGASILEFIDYLEINGAKEMKSNSHLLMEI
jgi:hypothetical protein